jgi:glycosyltransferase involved in cell wall biosynthesis
MKVGAVGTDVALSVIIAGRNAPQIVECLDALYPQAQTTPTEIIVADSSDDGTDEAVRRRFPDIRLLHFSDPLTLPVLRSRAIALARGSVIAILDAFSIVADNWVSEVLRAHRERPNLAIGGGVELFDASKQDLLNWAVYINEYGMFMPPQPASELDILPGSNISYKRAALFDDGKPKHDVYWKTFVNKELEAAGHPLWLDPDILVRLKKPIPIGDFFRTRYHHGRCFAGMRGASLGFAGRFIHAITFPALPFVFIWRWGSKYWMKGRYRSKFITTLPLQFLLFGSWSVGEFVGYLLGPGNSCEILYY